MILRESISYAEDSCDKYYHYQAWIRPINFDIFRFWAIAKYLISKFLSFISNAFKASLTPTAFGTTLPLNNTDEAFLQVNSTQPISGVNNVYDIMDGNALQRFTDKDQQDNFEASLDTNQQKVAIKIKHNHSKKCKLILDCVHHDHHIFKSLDQLSFSSFYCNV